MVNFPTQNPDCDSQNLALLNLFISPNPCVCSRVAFAPLRNSDQVVISASIDVQKNSKWDAPFDHTTYDYDLFVNIREMFHGSLSLNLVLCCCYRI